jgi:hypothetical protein
MILREVSSWELINCLYMKQHKKYGLMQGKKVVRFLSPEQLNILIDNKYYIVEKRDKKLSVIKNIPIKIKSFKLTEEDKLEAYKSIFVDDEEFINSFLDDERKE